LFQIGEDTKFIDSLTAFFTDYIFQQCGYDIECFKNKGNRTVVTAVSQHAISDRSYQNDTGDTRSDDGEEEDEEDEPEIPMSVLRDLVVSGSNINDK
jgi:hypothetical protein